MTVNVAGAADKKLGDFLLEHGWVTRDQLRRAEKTQRVVGDHLSTCLLEMDALTEDLLVKGLSMLHGLPGAGADELRGISEEVAALVPEKLACKGLAVPFRLVGSELSLAVAYPGDLAAQDEIAFATDKRLRAYVAAEVRILEALEKHYGAPCPERIGNLLDRLNRARYLWNRQRQEAPAEDLPPLWGTDETTAGTGDWEAPPLPDAAVSAEPPASPEPPRGHAPPRRPPPKGRRSIPLSAEERAELGKAATPRRSRAAAAPSTLPELERRLAAAEDREEVGDAVLGYLSKTFRRTLLLKVSRQGVAGWMGRGQGLSEDRLRSFRAPLDSPSVFLNLLQGSSLHFGLLAPMAVHRALARCWGGEPEDPCLVLPVRVRDKLVSAIYADRGEAGLGGVDLGEVQRVSACAGAAFERYLRQKKVRNTPGV